MLLVGRELSVGEAVRLHHAARGGIVDDASPDRCTLNASRGSVGPGRCAVGIVIRHLLRMPSCGQETLRARPH